MGRPIQHAQTSSRLTVTPLHTYVATIYDPRDLGTGVCVQSEIVPSQPIVQEDEMLRNVAFNQLEWKVHEIMLVDVDDVPERVDLTKPLIARRSQPEDDDMIRHRGANDQRLYEYHVYAMLKDS